MTAPIVNASSIPMTGNAVVTQGGESDLSHSTANAASWATLSPADCAESLARPGYFLLNLQAQRAPDATSDAPDDATNGTALPTGGNFLPLLLLSLWRQQPDPTTLPGANTGANTGATPNVAATMGDLPSGQVTGTATPVDPGTANSTTSFEPALQAAQKVLELLNAQIKAGATDLASANCAAPATPVASSVDPAAAVAVPAALIAHAAQIPPDMLAALVKRMTQGAASANAPPAQPDATAVLPLVLTSSNDADSAVGTADDIKQLIAALPKHTWVDQILSSTEAAGSDAGTDKAAAATLTAPNFVDGHALRAPSATALPTDAAAQTLRLDAPVRSPEWGQQLGERITWLVDQNLATAQIKLNPPQLGPIEVRIALSGDSTQVSVTAHNMITRDALEAAAPRLREALAAHGLGNVSVDISQQSFTDRGLPQSRASAFEPWQAPSSQVTATLPSAAHRLRLPGRLDAYA